MPEQNRHIIEPFFLPLGQESIFCLYLAPQAGQPKGAVLFLPPFAEEMHKSRRMVALQARRFAQAGYAVLQIDLPGCGDSSGDFEDASWDGWLDCARAACGWLREKTGKPIILWGLRLGAALAVETAAQTPQIAGLILWQPVTNGENFLNQFLRIRVASEMFSSQQKKTGITELRGLLAAGEAVEIAGYMLPPALALGIDTLRLARTAVSVPTHWFEVAQTPADSLPPASTSVVAAWKQGGTDIHTHNVTGEAFWASQEIMECPDLLRETSLALESLAP